MNKAIDVTILVLLAITVIWGVSFFFGFLFICRLQFGYLWGNVEDLLKCASTSMLNKAVSISDMIMDIMIMLFPMPLVSSMHVDVTETYGTDSLQVWQLQMSRWSKICVTIVFLLGAL